MPLDRLQRVCRIAGYTGRLPLLPVGVLDHDRVPLPTMNASVVGARHKPHALGLSVEAGMSEESPHEMRRIIRPDIQPNDTIRRVAKCGVEKVPVLSKECHATKAMQQWNNIGVLR